MSPCNTTGRYAVIDYEVGSPASFRRKGLIDDWKSPAAIGLQEIARARLNQILL